MKGKSIVRVMIAGIVCIGLILGYYYYLSNHTKTSTEEATQLTELEQVKTKDIDANYPKTPKAVVQLYARITCCFYNEDCKEDDIKVLGTQARKLLDDELLAENDEDSYYAALKVDILDYRNAGRTISKITLENGDEVEYKQVKGEKCAYVKAIYFIKEESSYSKTIQKFVLRQDENKRWKILGFYKEKEQEQ